MSPTPTASPQRTPVAHRVADELVRSKSGSPVWQLTATPVPAGSNLTSSIDFPPLGTRHSRAEERRTRDGREGSSLVFHDSHHAQLREVHGGNVRAIEAMEAANEKAETVDRRRTRPSHDEVNSLAEDARRKLAAEGEHVTMEKVVSKVCMLLQVSSLSALGIRSYWQLPALKEIERTVKEINLFVQSIEAICSMCTLYELGYAIAGIKNKKRFEELHLGPLCKIPIVHRLFTIDSNTKDDDILQIETVDLLRSLRNFRRKHSKQKIDLAEFLQYLADQYSCDSPYALGIRILSIGLPISTLSKAYGCESACMERAREAIQKEIEEEVENRLWKIKKSLMEPAQGAPFYSSSGSLELRRKYASMTAAEAVLEIFNNSVGIFNQKMTKRVQDFLTYVSADRLARTLFQLAICGGSLVVPNDLSPKEKPQKQGQEQKASEKNATETLPTEDAVKQHFQDCVSSFTGTVTLQYLSRLEKKLAKHFKFMEFGQLHQGSFLDFLVKNMQILQDAAGGVVAIGNQDIRANGFRPSQQDVYEFIKQCGETDPSRLPFIEAALRSHYGVQDSRELGYGKLRTLADFARRQKELCDGASASAVRYECPLLHKEPEDMLVESVGLLGDKTREQAVASLLSAPLLEDLTEWSQWQLVFQPNHGTLKHFIDKYCGNTDLLALEVSPGVLLRITSITGDKLFSEATQALDPAGTAGHLVSIVVADGISNTPTALLANHMQSSLAAAAAREDLSLGEDGCYFSTVAKYVLECVTRMPTKICKELLQQVFLEPLSRVLGQARSKAVLLEAAKSETKYLNKLHQLGILLGITEWVKDFHTKLILPLTPEVPPQNLPAVESAHKYLPADSMSDISSVLSLADGEDLLEDYVLSTASKSPQQDFNGGTRDGAEQDIQNDAEDEDEDLFELASENNEEVNSSVDSKEEDEKADGVEEPPEGHSEGDETVSEQLSQQRAIVEDIRKNEFGVGVELNEAGQNLMKKQQARLGRSLERLSTELYSKDTHFVLELIQNADDNSYPLDRKEEPALAFVVQKDYITILNNECGFEEKNVRAICDVGKSTKGKHTCGYIGQKGIGFKSVFKVTDCPEIHSNDFHIQFDKASGPMGYILPHWVEEERPVPSVAKEIAEKSWSTKIFLPLRSESYQTKNLFHDVHPSLMLFLHRLRSIIIYSEAERRLVSMRRRDLSHNMLEVEHSDLLSRAGGVERWLVVKRMLYPKKIKEDVESTELALAFQLSNDSKGEVKVQPRQQPVFAFLPLRSFGFRFVVQGDFDIPSSREDVDRDSSWNQWLRSEIPQLFLEAMDVFSLFAISSSSTISAQEVEMNTEEEEEDNMLHCWPPKKPSISKTGGRSTGKGSQAVEAVMKMWPPPAPLTSSAPVSPAPPGHWDSGAERSSASLNAQENTTVLHIHREPGPPCTQGIQGPRSSVSIPHAEEQPHKATVLVVQGVDAPNKAHGSSVAPGEHVETKPESNSTPSSAEPSEQVQKPVQAPEVMATQFQGSVIHRPPMPLDNAVWTKPTVAEAVLEDLALDFSLPDLLQVSNGYDDNADIGRWGEQLVHSFLNRWRESGEGPREIAWSNEKGESGKPYDFKLIFPSGCNNTREVFVEVKTTVKQEKNFIHLSANELDFALKEKEKYHIYRVYGAGHSQLTRLCRIKNLAQHLHSKTLELFLFV
ncbi:protein NO VEIN [Tachysurus ichikawai]